MIHRLLPVLSVVLATVAVGCSRASAPTLEPFTSQRNAFTIERPSMWHHVETGKGDRVWFLPAQLAPDDSPEGRATEFIVVMSQEQPGPLPEAEVRRLALSLLPMHGVSGFQRAPASTEQVVWYRFELTGSSAATEWASLGLFVSGPKRYHYVVCAAPLGAWRERQKLCDAVLRSFKPADQSP